MNALALLVAGVLIIQAGFTEPDVPFEEHDVWRDGAGPADGAGASQD